MENGEWKMENKKVPVFDQKAMLSVSKLNALQVKTHSFLKSNS